MRSTWLFAALVVGVVLLASIADAYNPDYIGPHRPYQQKRQHHIASMRKIRTFMMGRRGGTRGAIERGNNNCGCSCPTATTGNYALDDYFPKSYCKCISGVCARVRVPGKRMKELLELDALKTDGGCRC